MTVIRTAWGLVLGIKLLCGCAAADDDDVTLVEPPGADLDILARLQMLHGISNIEEMSDNTEGGRSFTFEIEQPIDHFHPNLGTFQMRAGLYHSDWSAPTTLWTTGYQLGSVGPAYKWNVPANGLTLEHRFFGPSTPGLESGATEPREELWQYLTVRQAAADHHHLIETFKPLYTGPWLSAGHSKGGLAALFHRRFYPDDVDGTVADGAPSARGIDDPRYEELLEQIGDAACRAKIIAIQREALSRRSELLPVFKREAENRGLSFDVVGVEVAFEHWIEDYRFKLWQTPGPGSACPLTSDPSTLSAESLFSELEVFSFISFASDQRLRGRDNYEAYYYQAATELGDHGPLERHLEDLIEFPRSYSAQAYAPGSAVQIDPAVMYDLEQWLQIESERIILVYGEIDPWRAGAFEVPSTRDVFSFVVPQETHGANLTSKQLPAAERARAAQLLQAWTGFEPKIEPWD